MKGEEDIRYPEEVKKDMWERKLKGKRMRNYWEEKYYKETGCLNPTALSLRNFIHEQLEKEIMRADLWWEDWHDVTDHLTMFMRKNMTFRMIGKRLYGKWRKEVD